MQGKMRQDERESSVVLHLSKTWSLSVICTAEEAGTVRIQGGRQWPTQAGVRGIMVRNKAGISQAKSQRRNRTRRRQILSDFLSQNGIYEWENWSGKSAAQGRQSGGVGGMWSRSWNCSSWSRFPRLGSLCSALRAVHLTKAGPPRFFRIIYIT